MIRRIQAENFMGYRHVDVKFEDKHRIVNIVGDNGAGKSSFLEMVPFALFGESRVPFDSLLKYGEDRLRVRVSIISGDEIVKVERTRRRTESSSRTTVAYGTRVYRNREATDFLVQYFGMDYFLFSIISYFGLGSGDQLVTATPKTRIGFLQKLANISIYLKLAQQASRAHRIHRDRLKELGAAVYELRRILDEDQEDDGSISAMEQENAQLDARRDALAAEQKAANSGRARVYHLNNERIRLNKLLASLEASLALLEKDVNTAAAKVLEMRAGKKRTQQEIVQVTRFLDRYPNGLALIDRKIGKLRSFLELVGLGLQNVHGKGCPLCGSEIDAGTVDRWKEEKDAHDKDLAVHVSFREKVRAGIEAEKRTTYALDQAKNEHDSLDHQLRQASFDVENRKQRVEKIDRELEKYREVVRGDHVEAEMRDVVNRIADNRARMAEIKKKKDRRSDWEQRLSDHVQDQQQAGLRMDVCDVLTHAFSQKGIPMHLLRDICREIEIEATELYKTFDLGSIVVQGLDGAEMDASFCLDTQSGVHRYHQLSAGQRTLLLLCVRLALANICFRNRGGTGMLDFLVLDEVCSNLSEQKIESLTLVLGKLLDSRFSQMFVISHVPLPNLQPDMTLRSEMVLGDSRMT